MKWIPLIPMLAGTGWLILEEQHWWAGAQPSSPSWSAGGSSGHSLSKSHPPN